MMVELLPALRAAKSDFGSGILILATIWLVAGADLQEIGYVEANESLRAFIDYVGRTGAVAGVLAVAYLFGAIWTAAVNRARLNMWLAVLRRGPLVPKSKGMKILAPFTDTAVDRIVERVNREFSKRLPDECIPTDVLDLVHRQVLEEALYVGPRLLYKSPAAFAEHSRLLGEGQFRDAIALPLVALGITVTVQSSADTSTVVIGVIALIFLAISLLINGRTLTRWANSQLAHPLAEGLIKTTTLENMQLDARKVVAKTEEKLQELQASAGSIAGSGNGGA